MASGADISMRVDGAADVMRAFAELSTGAQRRVARPAVREASTPVLRAIRKNAPRKKDPRTGQLRKSITRRLKTYKHSGAVIAIIGPRRKFITQDKYGRKVNPTKYAHLVEFGTAAHRVGNRMHPGAKPKPFMRPGWESSSATAMATMHRRLRIEIEKEGQRVAAKAARKAARGNS